MLVMTLVSGCGGASVSQRWHDNGPDDSAPSVTSGTSADPPAPTAPIFKRLPVNQPVAFLTIDDGWFQLPDDPRIMQAAHIPFTMFLIGPVAARNPAFFQQLEGYGGVVEDHTITHPEMKGK